MRRRYEWRRFWVAREGKFNFDSGGFLEDPEGRYGELANPEARSFEQIASYPCLVLLGEPGIGKTNELRKARSQTEHALAAVTGPALLPVNLNEYGDESRLIREVFEDPDFQRWHQGEHELILFIDSLDECMLSLETVTNVLASRLRRCDVKRLQLRIACRTAVWPSSLEDVFIELWGKEQVGLYELLPLRRVDVGHAAEVWGLSSKAFLEQVEARRVTPFAIKPLTLEFLLGNYQRAETLPPNAADLYLEGCRWLCEESNLSRVDSGRTGRLSSDQRLAVASRLAALTLFCGRTAISLATRPDEINEGDLPLREVLGGIEQERGQSVEITEGAVREALDTGLFSSRGPNLLGWAHQSYGEFLAARYLYNHRFALPQILSLLTHPSEPDLVVPQLAEVAGWIVTLDSAVFNALASRNPHVLLRGNVQTWGPERGAVLTASLLREHDEKKLTDSDRGLRQSYSKLSYSGLAQELAPYVRDHNRNPVVRRVAIQIAAACGVKELQKDLAQLALDPTDSSPTRSEAIAALKEIGDSAIRLRLKPAINTSEQEDPDDQIKGNALRVLWPDLLTVDDLLASLTPPRRKSLFGAYYVFLHYELGSGLRVEDLPAALAWAAQQTGQLDPLSHLWGAIDQILLKAWSNLDATPVLSAFAEFMLARTRPWDPVFRRNSLKEREDPIAGDVLKRRQLLEAMVAKTTDSQEMRSVQFLPLLRREDLTWLLQRLCGEPSEDRQRIWAKLVQAIFNPENSGASDAVLSAATQNAILAQEMAGWIEPVNLTSPQAARARELYGPMIAHQLPVRRGDDASVAQRRIAKLLDRIDTGELDAWWGIDWHIVHDLDGTRTQVETAPDLQTFPLWHALDQTLRERVREAAHRYVSERQGPREGEVERFSELACASYRAFRLVLELESGLVESLSSEVWSKWAQIFTRSSIALLDHRDQYQHLRLVRLAYQHAPEEMLTVFARTIDDTSQRDERAFIDEEIHACWDTRLAETLVTKLKDSTLSPRCLRSILRWLLDHHTEKAQAWARDLLSQIRDDEDKRYVQVAANLLMHPEKGGWEAVWPKITENPKFGQEVVTSVAYDLEDREAGGRMVRRLSEDQVADLYIWLVGQYPPAEDPQHDGIHRLGPLEAITSFRDRLVHHLMNAGTVLACVALKRIAETLPELPHLQWLVAEARRQTLVSTWVPPEPQQVIALTERASARIVSSGEQLLEVVLESLRSLEGKLHGHYPRIERLWNEISPGIWRPKEEESLSDFVRDHLQDELGSTVISHREIQIRRPLRGGARQGQVTDIALMPRAEQPGDGLSQGIWLTLESKGCWNRNLQTDMKEQLVDRYLRESECRYGLYLVGWFLCDAWDRKGDTPKWSLQEARDFFDRQAEELSQEGLVVRAFVLDTALR